MNETGLDDIISFIDFWIFYKLSKISVYFINFPTLFVLGETKGDDKESFASHPSTSFVTFSFHSVPIFMKAITLECKLVLSYKVESPHLIEPRTRNTIRAAHSTNCGVKDEFNSRMR